MALNQADFRQISSAPEGCRKLAGGVSHRKMSPCNEPRQGRRISGLTGALPPFHRPCRGGWFFSIPIRWLTPPANFPLSLRDGRSLHDLASVIFWDACGQFFVETFSTDVPLEILEALIAETRERVPI